jgi:2-methylcitrate dehydratase PrpD
MSLPYSIAVALATGSAMLDEYTAEALRRTDVLDLASRVHVVHEPSVADGEEPHVDVELTDGRVLSGRVLVARGDYTNPLSEDELRAKFRTTAGLVLAREQVGALERIVARIETLKDSRELTALLVPDVALAGRRAEGAVI